MTDLLKQIDDLVASKTFNLDALEGIKQIKDRLAAVIAENERLAKQIKLTQEDMLAETRKREAAEANAKELQQRLIGMNDIATKGADAIWERKVAEASAAAYKDALYTVFKPNAVRENIHRNHTVVVPTGPNTGYTQAVQNQEHIMREDA